MPFFGMADLLWDTVLNREQREYVGRFRRAGGNLLSLINDILDLSKIESGRFDLESVDFDLLELIDRVMEIASPGAILRGIALEHRNCSRQPPRCSIGDPVRLQQVLNNLDRQRASNSLTSGPCAGSHRNCIPPGKPGHLAFAVSDTGIGIPADKLGCYL